VSSRGELRGHEVFLERSLVSLPLQLIGLITVLPTKPVFVDEASPWIRSAPVRLK
jgi:hypothetical protein